MHTYSSVAIQRIIIIAFAALLSLTLSSKTDSSSQAHLVTSPVVMTSLDEQIKRFRLFEEPLKSLGCEPSEAENQALLAALTTYQLNIEDALPLETYVSQFPNSPWNGSLLTNLGLAYYGQARFSKALFAWERAWQVLKKQETGEGKLVADRALGEMMEMYARLGRMESLTPLFQEIQGRKLIGKATERITAAQEGLWQMENYPGSAFLCGPYALNAVATFRGKQVSETLFSLSSTPKGTSLIQNYRLSQKVGMKMQMAHRSSIGEIITPAVIHWKLGHFAAILKKQEDRYLIVDTTFGGRWWATKETLDEEGSGYFLIPKGKLPNAWRTVALKEGGTVWGRGATKYNDRSQTQDTAIKTNACASGGMGSPPKMVPKMVPMAQYDIQAMVVGLTIFDAPVGYTPPIGPDAQCKITYNQREDSQVSYETHSNFGPKWVASFIGYAVDVPSLSLTPVGIALRGGGYEEYSNTGGSQPYLRNVQSLAEVKPIRVNNVTRGYERLLRDGSKETYDVSDGGTGSLRRFFLSKVTDPQGNTLTFTYININNGIRLGLITDAIGQRTVLSYELSSDPFKITKITDPFGRSATFTYTNGLLTKITDIIGLSSEFSYDGDFIQKLTTPYGITTFKRQEPASRDPFRWLEATDALGQTERAEFRHQAPGLTSKFPTSEIPTEVVNDLFQYRNTFYWDKVAYNRFVKGKNVQSLPQESYDNAKVYHWLHTSNTDAQNTVTSGVIESVGGPLERRIFYDYWRANGTLLSKRSDRYLTYLTEDTIGHAPAFTGRKLDDGSTQHFDAIYNNLGYALATGDPSDRITLYQYDSSNQIDLLSIEQTDDKLSKKEKLLTLSDYVKHHPQRIKDASGRETRIAYNDAGQGISNTNARNETTRIEYYPNRYIKQIIGADGLIARSFTYDEKNRVKTSTDSEGFTLSYEYDNADRPRKITYPDGTFEEFTYNRLDLETARDRQGRITTYKYNALRQLIDVTDAKGQKTLYDWCGCGSMMSITDPAGRKTSFERDVQGRVIKKIYDDGSFTSYQYEASTSRLKSVTPPDGATVNYDYYADNNLRRIIYSRTSSSRSTTSAARRQPTSRGTSTPTTPSNLLLNPSFEAGPVGLGLTSIPNWTIVRGNVDVIPNASSAQFPDWHQAADGTRSLELIGTPGAATIEQSFATQPGQRYSFSGWVSHHFGIDRAAVSVSVNGVALTTLSVSGQNSQANMRWERFSREVIANAATTTLRLTDQNLAGWENGGAVIDGLSVTLMSASVTAPVADSIDRSASSSNSNPIRESRVDEAQPTQETSSRTLRNVRASGRRAVSVSQDAIAEAAGPGNPYEVSFTYDKFYNRLESFTDQFGTTKFTYYPVDGITLGAGQLASVDGPFSDDLVAYEYDELGRVTKRTLNGVAVGVEYDPLGRISKNNNSALGSFLYEYINSTSRLKQLTRGSNGYKTEFDYYTSSEDPRLKTLRNSWGATQGASFSYSYFPGGSIKEWGGNVTSDPMKFVYDGTDQLLSAALNTNYKFSYDYDKAGNRLWEEVRLSDGTALRTDYTTNRLNQITGEKKTNPVSGAVLLERKLEYDQSGNLTKITPISGGGQSVTYSWDTANRLASIKIGTRESKISYDGLSRWAVIWEVEGGDAVLDRKELTWCGTSLCQEKSIRGVRKFFAQGFVDYDSKKYFYNKDHLGSIIEVLDETGQVVSKYVYDPYGNRRVVFESVPSSFGFTGHYYHAPSGLHLAPYRAYSAELGRWISRDPIGEHDGTNVYAYAHSLPINRTDPLGLQSVDCSCGLGATSIGAVGPIDAAIAGGIGLIARNIAWREAPSLPGGRKGINNGAAGAFRHCYWSCLLTREFGVEQASAITDIYEACGGNPPSETQMDQFNNAVGRGFGSISTGSCRQKCRDAATNGGLQTSLDNPIPFFRVPEYSY